jgi:hypothetical protein
MASGIQANARNRIDGLYGRHHEFPQCGDAAEQQTKRDRDDRCKHKSGHGAQKTVRKVHVYVRTVQPLAVGDRQRDDDVAQYGQRRRQQQIQIEDLRHDLPGQQDRHDSNHAADEAAQACPAIAQLHMACKVLLRAAVRRCEVCGAGDADVFDRVHDFCCT